MITFKFFYITKSEIKIKIYITLTLTINAIIITNIN